MSVNQRLKIIIKNSNLSQAEFARDCEISQSAVHTIYNDKNSPNFETVEKIAMIYKEYSAEWILRGKLPMYNIVNKEEKDTEINREIAKIIGLEGVIPNIFGLEEPKEKYKTSKTIEERLSDLEQWRDKIETMLNKQK